MDLEAMWDKALKHTEVVRSRLSELATFNATSLPYIFLAESSLNEGDTVVRKGHIMVERPSLILPNAQFEGFEFQHDLHFSDDAVLNFLLVRGIRFPSLRYRHELSSLDLREGSLQQAIDHFNDQLKRAEDIHTGLVIGPEDVWQLSALILVGSSVSRSAGGDLRRLFEAWRRRQQQ